MNKTSFEDMAAISAAYTEQTEQTTKHMKRHFEVSGYFLENLNTCIYLQFVDECGERCRLLEEYYSPMSHQYTRTLLKARKIYETRSGEYYILLRGRRVRLDAFLRAGSVWSSLPEGYTVEY